MRRFLLSVIISVCWLSGFAQENAPMAQYPSPMQEHVRKHHIIADQTFSGSVIQIAGFLSQQAAIFIPAKARHTVNPDVFVQFFGTSNTVSYAADHYHGRLIAVMVNLGSGSSAYGLPFLDSSVFETLLDTVQTVVSANLKHPVKFRRIMIGGFSAGYGAVRAILNIVKNRKLIDDVLLLDGLHASYVPERQVLAKGGHIDSSAYTGILAFCRLATHERSGKKILFTHSEIFPGTFVSTTESANLLLNELDIKQQAVLKWGPGGMQQISNSRKGGFRIMGFAGNTAPDHTDHLQNLSFFLNRLVKL